MAETQIRNKAELYSIDGSSLLVSDPTYFFVNSKYVIDLPDGFRQEGFDIIAPDGSHAVPIKTVIGILLLYPMMGKQGSFAVADIDQQYVYVADE